MPNDDWFINANEAYDLLMKQAIIDSQPRAIRRAARMVIEFPAADVEPVRHGHYIGTEFDGYSNGNPVYYEWKCSECDCVFEDDEPKYRYCPNCGAKMLTEPPKGGSNGKGE